MYKIRKYFEKGQPHACNYCKHETARICPDFCFWVIFDHFSNLLCKNNYFFFTNETKCFLLHLKIWLSRKIDWCILLRGIYTEEYSWRLILFLIHICYTSIILSFIVDLSFLFIFLRWINSNKFELIHLHKNMKIG